MSKQQVFANEFDCELYRLISRAETISDQYGDDWLQIAATLRSARPYVRSKMSKEDIEATI